MKNKLSLVVTIHSDFNSVQYYHGLLSKVDNQVIYAFDNPDIPKEIMEYIFENELDYFVNEKNCGKLKLILNLANKIKGEFFKILDQDDSINVDDLIELNAIINELNDSYIIKHIAYKMNSDSKYFERSSFAEIIDKQIKDSFDVSYNQQTNCDTIYNVKKIVQLANSGIELNRQDFHNDVLISNYVVGRGEKFLKIDKGFYIQFHEKGQTADKRNIKRAICILELYENYEKLSKYFADFKISRTLEGDKNNHIRFIRRFTIEYLSEIDIQLGKELFESTIKILDKIWT